MAEERARLLKRDAFGYVELLTTNAGERYVRRVAAGCGKPGLAWLGRLLLHRERRALMALAGLPGVPQLVADPSVTALPAVEGFAPRAPQLVRTWLPGVPLHEATWLPRDFFERLEELVRRLHARGVCHNDLHKEQNVIVGPDGWPGLIDFQLASVHRRRGRRFARRAREDLRHVAKHRRRYLRRGAAVPPPEAAAVVVPRRSWTGWLIRRVVQPCLRAVGRGILGVRDREPRRATPGPWPVWGPALQGSSRNDPTPGMRPERE